MSKITLSLLTLFALTLSLPVSASLAPKKGESITFKRTYSVDELKNRPLQLVKKTSFTLRNVNGLLTGNWKATIRTIRNDETVEGSATALCRARNQKQVECTFGTDNGTILLTRLNAGLDISIPVSQGVRFDKKVDGESVWAEMLLGAEEENSHYILRR